MSTVRIMLKDIGVFILHGILFPFAIVLFPFVIIAKFIVEWIDSAKKRANHAK